MTKRVVVTGAAGNVGQKLLAHLSARGAYEVVALDRDPRGQPGVIAADLAAAAEDWSSRLEGAWAVVHLAAESRPRAPWERLCRDNVEALIHVLDACVRHRARRLVFASTVRTMLGYRGEAVRIAADLPPRPADLYAATKLVGEALARRYATLHGLSTVCLRLGWVQEGDNVPGVHMGRWGQQLWLSDRDACDGIERAIEVENLPFAVVHLVSDVAGAPWDLDEPLQLLGYRPRDRHVPRWPLAARVRSLLGRLFRRTR